MGQLESLLGISAGPYGGGLIASVGDGLHRQRQYVDLRNQQFSALNAAGLQNAFAQHNQHAPIDERDMRERENDNLTRLWERFTKTPPILTRILIWVSAGLGFSYVVYGGFQR